MVTYLNYKRSFGIFDSTVLMSEDVRLNTFQSTPTT